MNVIVSEKEMKATEAGRGVDVQRERQDKGSTGGEARTTMTRAHNRQPFMVIPLVSDHPLTSTLTPISPTFLIHLPVIYIPLCIHLSY